MKITWFYTGDDGRSHFADIDIPAMTNLGVTNHPTEGGPVRFRESAPSVLDFHPAPMRQLVIIITGVMEIEMGDGSKRAFRPGDVFLADDLTGQGHITRTFGGPRHSIQLGVPADVNVAQWRVG